MAELKVLLLLLNKGQALLDQPIENAGEQGVQMLALGLLQQGKQLGEVH